MSENRMANSDEFRNELEKRKGTKWYDSASKVGELHDPRIDDNKGKEMYSGAEIRAEMRHGRGDMTTEELTKQYEQDYASGKINLNGNAKDFLTQHHGASLMRANKGGGDKDPVATTPVEDKSPEPTPVREGPTQTITPPGLMPGIPTPGSNGINFSQTQDNDQTITNNGDNNVNNQNMDNSNSINQGGAYGFSKDWMNKYFNNVGV
jgi:hypothetical protein